MLKARVFAHRFVVCMLPHKPLAALYNGTRLPLRHTAFPICLYSWVVLRPLGSQMVPLKVTLNWDSDTYNNIAFWVAQWPTLSSGAQQPRTPLSSLLVPPAWNQKFQDPDVHSLTLFFLPCSLWSCFSINIVLWKG